MKAITESLRDHWNSFITHLIYLEGVSVPPTNKQYIEKRGIECIRLYGKKDGILNYYDDAGLVQALSAILGTRDRGVVSRRNSLYS